MIYIEWDVVMTDTMLNNTEYWVSAGAEYSNNDELWVGSAMVSSILGRVSIELWVGSASFMSLLDEYNEVCLCYLLSKGLITFFRIHYLFVSAPNR